MLQRTYEQIIVQATLNPTFGALLVADPRRAALDAGYSPLVAESLAGLRAGSVPDFAVALHRRVYGTGPDCTASIFPALGQAADGFHRLGTSA